MEFEEFSRQCQIGLQCNSGYSELTVIQYTARDAEVSNRFQPLMNSHQKQLAFKIQLVFQGHKWVSDPPLCFYWIIFLGNRIQTFYQDNAKLHFLMIYYIIEIRKHVEAVLDALCLRLLIF